jgi:hypothetical protein
MTAKTALEKQKKETEAKHKRLLAAVHRISKTEAGRLFFRHLMHECGFLLPSAVMSQTTGQILVDNTVWNEARRDLYLTTRRLIPPKELVKIEFNLENLENSDVDIEEEI